MSRDIRNYTIEVTKPGSDYLVRLLDKDGTPIGPTQAIDFDKHGDQLKKTDHYKLNFRIDDSTLAQADKVKFAPANEDVLWVWTNTTECPPPGSEMPYTFWVDKNNNGKDLRVINMNLCPERLRFQINMVKRNDPAARPFIVLDPIVNNGNNGGSEPLVASSQSVMIGGVTGAIVAIGTVMLVNNGLVPLNPLLLGIGGALIGLVVGFLFGRK